MRLVLVDRSEDQGLGLLRMKFEFFNNFAFQFSSYMPHDSQILGPEFCPMTLIVRGKAGRVIGSVNAMDDLAIEKTKIYLVSDANPFLNRPPSPHPHGLVISTAVKNIRSQWSAKPGRYLMSGAELRSNLENSPKAEDST